jgi:hypothetical protein
MPSKESLTDVAKKAAIVALVGILLYVIIGITVNAFSTRIYDEFSTEFEANVSDPEQMFECSINNNAPMSLPFINPFYSAQVTLADSGNDTFCYFFNTASKKCNFTDYSLDLGRIDSGSSRKFDFYLHLGPHNVTFSVRVFYSFFTSFQVSSTEYTVAYEGNQTYSVSKP